MRSFLPLAVTAVCLTSAANADDFSFDGTFGNDDDVVIFGFLVGGTSDVTLRSYSYAGGTQADGTVVPSGGLDPILARFDASGQAPGQQDDGFGVPPGYGPHVRRGI